MPIQPPVIPVFTAPPVAIAVDEAPCDKVKKGSRDIMSRVSKLMYDTQKMVASGSQSSEIVRSTGSTVGSSLKQIVSDIEEGIKCLGQMTKEERRRSGYDSLLKSLDTNRQLIESMDSKVKIYGDLLNGIIIY